MASRAARGAVYRPFLPTISFRVSQLHHTAVLTDPSGYRAKSDPTKGGGGQRQPRFVEKQTEQPTVQNIDEDIDGVLQT